MTTPAEEIRAAVAKLREKRAKATPGPWQFVPELYWDRAGIMSDSPEAMGWAALVMDVHNDSEHGNAGWMALMHPGVGQALVDMLDAMIPAIEDGSTCPPSVLKLVREITGGDPS